MVLPLCMDCRNKKLSPKLVGSINQVEKERAKREEQAKKRAAKATKASKAAEAKAAKAAAAAAAAAAEDESEDEAAPMEEEATSGGSGAGNSGNTGSSVAGSSAAGSSAAGSSGSQKRPAGELSKTSGAAKRRAKKVAAAAAEPLSLPQLINVALPRLIPGRIYYRSMLRQMVVLLDKRGPKRTFGDKDEWRHALRQMQSAGVLTYNEDRDEFVLPLPADGSTDV
jgi:cobalamin biosynthesis Mg chelatase CobN